MKNIILIFVLLLPAGRVYASESVNNSEMQTEQNININTGRKKLTKKPFVIALTSTIVSGITFLVLDGVVHSKYNTTEDIIDMGYTNKTPEQFVNGINSEINTIENLQIAGKVFLGITIGAAITTGILAIFTDFKSADKLSLRKKHNTLFRASLSPYGTGAGISLSGKF